MRNQTVGCVKQYVSKDDNNSLWLDGMQFFVSASSWFANCHLSVLVLLELQSLLATMLY